MSATISCRREGHVAVLEFSNPPYNFLNTSFLTRLADQWIEADADPSCRSVVLVAGGAVFSAGADFGSDATPAERDPARFYEQALRLFSMTKPVVAAVQGAAIGAGLGLALAADFRVTCAEARFSANFNRLGIHPGFGVTYTLPRLVGHQRAAILALTGRRIPGEEAFGMGLADMLVEHEAVPQAAIQLAEEISMSAPNAVQTTRKTLRGSFEVDVRRTISHELEVQLPQYGTKDFAEGVAAMAARRVPNFIGE